VSRADIGWPSAPTVAVGQQAVGADKSISVPRWTRQKASPFPCRDGIVRRVVGNAETSVDCRRSLSYCHRVLFKATSENLTNVLILCVNLLDRDPDIFPWTYSPRTCSLRTFCPARTITLPFYMVWDISPTTTTMRQSIIKRPTVRAREPNSGHL